MSFTAFAADTMPASSDEFKKTSATLVSSSSLMVSFDIVTRDYSNELGITTVRILPEYPIRIVLLYQTL